MHDYWQTVISRQFAAAIQMLRSAVEACPDNLWDDRTVGTPFWHLAYHALFYTDFSCRTMRRLSRREIAT